MSARIARPNSQWARVPADKAGVEMSEWEVQLLSRNVEPNNLVAPLRELLVRRTTRAQAGSEQTRRSALALQHQFQSSLRERELLRRDIERGRDFLKQVKQGSASLRSCLEQWVASERISGANPAPDYWEAIAAHEQLEKFLPAWLKRREARLRAVCRELKSRARENGLEHLL